MSPAPGSCACACSSGCVGAGLALALTGYGLDAATGADEKAERTSFWGAVWTARPHSSGLLEVIGSGGFALLVMGACLLACRTVLTWVVLPIRAVGAMPLTAYTAQLLVWAVIAAAVLGDTGDLRGFRDLEPFGPLVLWTILGCTAWALLVARAAGVGVRSGRASCRPRPQRRSDPRQ